MSDTPTLFDNYGRPLSDKPSSKRDKPGIIEELRGVYFISEREVDTETGEFNWIASPIDPNDKAQEIKIRVPRGADNRPQLLNVLSDNWDMAKLHLVRREDSDCYEVLGAESKLPDDQRKVFDEHGEAYTWTRALDAKVDEYFHHSIQAVVYRGTKDLLDSPESGSKLNARAREIFAEQMAEAGDKRTADELKSIYDSDISPSLEGTHSSFADIIQGRQLNAKGGVEKVFYNTTRSFKGNEPGVFTNPEGQTAAVANYAAQRAAYEYIHSYCSQTFKDNAGTDVSLLEYEEHKMVEDRTLFGFHPTRTSNDYQNLTAEFAERLSMNTLQGMSQACGARAANVKFDHVTPTNKSDRDQNGRPYTLQSYMYENTVGAGLLKSYAEHEGQNLDCNDWLKQYNTLCLDLNTEHRLLKEEAIASEMDKAMANGRTRLTDPSEKTKKRLEMAAVCEKGFMGLLGDLEEPPEIT